MRTRILAFLQLVLILPALLFMASLIVRNLGWVKYEPAHSAQQIVIWYAGRLWTLWVLLFALPCMALFSGCAVLRTRDRDPAGDRDTDQNGTRRSPASSGAYWPVRLVTVTTVASAGILTIVGFHVLTH